MNMVLELLSSLSAKGIHIKLDNENLSVDAPKGSLTPSIIQSIQAHKPELVAYLAKKAKTTDLPLQKAEIAEYYPLSEAQKRMYVLQQLFPDSIAYNMVTQIPLDPSIAVEQLENALKEIIQRHESLRTYFPVVEEVPVQKVEKDMDFSIEEVQVKDQSEEEVVENLVRPFALDSTPLLRAFIVKKGSEKMLLLDMHHIVTDGVSQEIIAQEFSLLYQGTKLPPAKYQYKDFACMQSSPEYTARTQALAQFWKDQFTESTTELALPYDYPRGAIKSNSGKSLRFFVDPKVTEATRKLASDQNLTMFMVAMGVFKVFLHQLTQQRDLIIGVPFSGRSMSATQSIVGMFINTLPIRTNLEGDPSFSSFLKQIKSHFIAVLEHQDYPFDTLVAELEVPRVAGKNPIFEVLFEYFDKQKTEIQEPKEGEYNKKTWSRGYAQFDCGMNITDCGKFLCVDLDFDAALFSSASIMHTAEKFLLLWKSLVENTEMVITDSLLLTSADQQLLSKWNATQYPIGSGTIVDKFLTCAAQFPMATAVQMGTQTKTYATVEKESEAIAKNLKSNFNVQTGDVIGVHVPRNVHLISLIYGILRAGAVYMPLDPAHPMQRKNEIVKDSNAKLLLSDLPLDGALGPVVLYFDLLEVANETPSVDLPALSKETLMYLLYTSGSTGKPKGVMVSHGALVNRLEWMQHAYPIGEEAVLLQKTPLTFDVSIWELFWWSFTGAKLVIAPPEAEKQPSELLSLIKHFKVTTVHFVPSMLSLFLEIAKESNVDDLKSIKQVFCSGEALLAKQVAAFKTQFAPFASQVKLINLYGPTEATIDVSHYPIAWEKEATNIPIGRPIHNTQLLVLNAKQQLLPPGVPGELYIGGMGLAQGYLNNPELSKEKFMNCPGLPYGKLYKTGDLARWNTEGQLEYLGRIDHQVKIRGLRIELEEIERAMGMLEGIQEAHVVVHGREENKVLVGYYSGIEQVEYPVFTKEMQKTLPVYMVPTHFVYLEAIPLTSSGKADRKALSKLPLALQSKTISPLSPMETAIAQLWSEVLQIDTETIDRDTSFFLLGGHSLLAINLLNKIHKQFDVALQLQQMLARNTVANMAEDIENAQYLAQPKSVDSIQKMEVFEID